MTIEIKGEQDTDVTEIETLRTERDRYLSFAAAQEYTAKSFRDIAADYERKMQALEAAAPKPWPQVGDEYWSLNTSAKTMHLNWDGGRFDKGALSIGNAFQTQDEAIDERDRRKVAAIMREMADGGTFGIYCDSHAIHVSLADEKREFCTYRYSTIEQALRCRTRIVTELSEGGTRDGMARLLQIWGGK